MKLVLTLLAVLWPLATAAQHSHSAYAGMENRDIKSLSESDLEDLRRGAGWGLALAAELNGVPGPAHLLELKDQIGLSAEQVRAIEEIFAQMKSEAQAAGAEFIAAETSHRGRVSRRRLVARYIARLDRPLCGCPR